MHTLLSTVTPIAMTKSSAVAARHDAMDAETDWTDGWRNGVDEMSFCILLVINCSAFHTVNEFYIPFTHI